MALIVCPECGRQVSDKAAACPNCGSPISAMFNKKVMIRMPAAEQVATGWVGLFMSKDAYVSANNRILWKGQLGQSATFELERPMKVEIDIGKWGNVKPSVIQPGKRYEVVQDMSPHWKASFYLSEVDVIDSGR